MQQLEGRGGRLQGEPLAIAEQYCEPRAKGGSAKITNSFARGHSTDPTLMFQTRKAGFQGRNP